jgi:putative transposase
MGRKPKLTDHQRREAIKRRGFVICGRGIDTLTTNEPVVLVWATKPISYACHRFTHDVIRNAVWLYLWFTLSYRDVEDLLAERGLMVSNESIRRWCSNSDQSLLGIYGRSGVNGM